MLVHLEIKKILSFLAREGHMRALGSFSLPRSGSAAQGGREWEGGRFGGLRMRLQFVRAS